MSERSILVVKSEELSLKLLFVFLRHCFNRFFIKIIEVLAFFLKLNLKTSSASTLHIGFYYLILFFDCESADVGFLKNLSELRVSVI